VAQPLEVDDFDVVSVSPFGEQVLARDRADQQQSGPARAGAEPVSRFIGTIAMVTPDPLACPGFADGGDAPRRHATDLRETSEHWTTRCLLPQRSLAPHDLLGSDRWPSLR
jgi:hypothetical protein